MRERYHILLIIEYSVYKDLKEKVISKFLANIIIIYLSHTPPLVPIINLSNAGWELW